MWRNVRKEKKPQPDSSISRRNSGEINIGIKKYCWPFLWEFLCPPHCDIDSKFGRMVVLHQGCTLVSVWKSAGACKTLIPLLITGFVTYIHKSFAPSCMEGATEGSNWVNRVSPASLSRPSRASPVTSMSKHGHWDWTSLAVSMLSQRGTKTRFGIAEWEVWLGRLGLGGLDSQWEGTEEESDDLGGITAWLKGWWGRGVAEVGKNITERSLGARRESKYELWFSLLEENVLTPILLLLCKKI